MTVKTGITWTGLIVTKDATGALSAATVGPVGTLYVNGVANAAAVAIAGANPYSWSVVLPALAVGDRVSMYITATVALIATAAVVAEESADTHLTSDLSARIPAALVGGRMDSSVGAIANNAITAAAIANGAIDAATFAAGAIDATAIATGAIDADALAASATDEITDSVWAEPLPGAYVAGTAGFILGNLLTSITALIAAIPAAVVAALVASAAFLNAIAGAVWGWGSRTLTSLATYLIGSIREFIALDLALEFCQGESPVIDAVIERQGGGVFDITGYTVVWILSEKRGGAALLTKSTALGTLTITDPTHGGIQFSLTSAETNALAAATYWHECHIKAPAPSLREYCAFHGRCTVTESTIGVI